MLREIGNVNKLRFEEKKIFVEYNNGIRLIVEQVKKKIGKEKRKKTFYLFNFFFFFFLFLNN